MRNLRRCRTIVNCGPEAAGRRELLLVHVVRVVAPLAAGVAFGMLLARCAPVGRYVVEGASMEPAYRSGDRVLVNRLAYRRSTPVAGDVVVLRDPEREGRYLIKRVATPPLAPRASTPDAVWVQGDNTAESRDSRSFGAVPRASIIGRVWRRY